MALVMATEETVSDDGSGGLILEWQILDIGKKQQVLGVQFSNKSLEVVLGKSYRVCLFSPRNEGLS